MDAALYFRSWPIAWNFNGLVAVFFSGDAVVSPAHFVRPFVDFRKPGVAQLVVTLMLVYTCICGALQNTMVHRVLSTPVGAQHNGDACP